MAAPVVLSLLAYRLRRRARGLLSGHLVGVDGIPRGTLTARPAVLARFVAVTGATPGEALGSYGSNDGWLSELPVAMSINVS